MPVRRFLKPTDWEDEGRGHFQDILTGLTDGLDYGDILELIIQAIAMRHRWNNIKLSELLRVYESLGGLTEAEVLELLNGEAFLQRNGELRREVQPPPPHHNAGQYGEAVIVKKRRKTQYAGVQWSGISKKWRALIKVNGEVKFLGLFDSDEEAARAYDKAARELFGDAAKVNFKD